MSSITLEVIAYVLLLVAALFGIIAKDWRASFATLAIALVLLILLLVGVHR